MQKKVLAAMFALGASGCATSSFESEQTRLQNPELSDFDSAPFEGELTKKSGEWDIDFVPEGGNMVYQDAWKAKAYSAETASCQRGLFGAMGSEPCAEEIDLPHGEWVETTSMPSPAANLMGTALSTAFSPFALLIAPLDGGDAFSQAFLGVTYDHQFSWEGFADSLESAKVNEAGSVDEFDDQLSEAITSLQRLKNDVHSFNEEATFNRLPREAEDKRVEQMDLYEDRVIDNAKLNIDDQSGLLPSSKRDINLDKSDIVAFEVESPKIPDFKKDLYSLPDIEGNSLTELKDVVKKAEEDFRSSKGPLKDDREENKKRFQAFLGELSEYNGDISYKPRSNAFGESYNVEWTFPESQIRNGEVEARGPITATIKGVDKKNVRPDSFRADGEQLMLKQRGTKLTWINKSDQYITIKNISMYYGKKILTLTNQEGLITLPPNSQDDMRVNKFQLSKLPDDYDDLTLEQAREERIEYGFGARYETTESSEMKRFVGTKSIRVADML